MFLTLSTTGWIYIQVKLINYWFSKTYIIYIINAFPDRYTINRKTYINVGFFYKVIHISLYTHYTHMSDEMSHHQIWFNGPEYIPWLLFFSPNWCTIVAMYNYRHLKIVNADTKPYMYELPDLANNFLFARSFAVHTQHKLINTLFNRFSIYSLCPKFCE